MIVLFKEHARADNGFVGEIKLNSPKTLNALSLPMIRLIKDQLEKWKNNPQLTCVFLHGEGEKSFCAGGDVKNLYKSILQARAQGDDAGEAVQPFFEEEYQLDHLMHNYPKPIVTWGHGIVMGGGLGLFVASSCRVLTEKSSLAMPEIHIGLFPDVGGSYFLSRLPHHWGWYIAMTAHRMNSQEALLLNFGNVYFKESEKSRLWDLLLTTNFTQNEQLLTVLQENQNQTSFSEKSYLEIYQSEIESMMESENLKQIHSSFSDSFFKDIEAKNKTMLKTAKRDRDNFLKGAPSSLALICEQLKRGRNSSLKDVFKMELELAKSCARHVDFTEGVRAVLVDKDFKPHWNPSSVEQIQKAWLFDVFFKNIN